MASDRTKALIKLISLLAAVALAVAFAIRQGNSALSSGEEQARVWFYDLSEKRLYTARADTIPPDKGVGGHPNDGVRATVVTFGTGKKPENQRIAYLATYTPELSAILSKLQQARRDKKPVATKIPDRDSDFFQTNSLVKLPEEPQWHPLNSPEGQKVTTQWRSWRGPNAEPPEICVP